MLWPIVYEEVGQGFTLRCLNGEGWIYLEHHLPRTPDT
jgi:hypothetical protein